MKKNETKKSRATVPLMPFPESISNLLEKDCILGFKYNNQKKK
jgi:hypothetical protein